VKLPARWDRIEGTLWIAGAIAAAVSALGLFLDPVQFFRSYLFAYLVCLGIPMGSMAILLLHYLTGGNWGLVLRGTLESVLATLPVLALLFVPLALGVKVSYPWADPDIVAHDPTKLLQHKAPYLNVPFFLIRACIYFAAWLVIGWLLRGTSVRQTRGWSVDRHERMRAFAGPCLGLYGLTVTFAAIDWIMSLEPHWFSSIFGALIAVGWLLPGMAFAILLLTQIAPTAGDAEVEQGPDKNLWNDLGTLLFAFVMLWAYLSFSQLILIWAGNLPEEVTWYLHRIEGGWVLLAWALFLFYFAFPFLLLLSRDVKQRPERLGKAALALLVMHVIYQFWLVRAAPLPEKPGTELRPVAMLHWLDATLLIALVSVWLALVVRSLRAGQLFPSEDPAWKEFAAHAAQHAEHARA
jgi:hypothetical protein